MNKANGKKMSAAKYQMAFGLVVLILTFAYTALLYSCVAFIEGPPTGAGLFFCAPLIVVPSMALAIMTTQTLFEIFDS